MAILRCYVCGLDGAHPIVAVARAQIVWHVYREHAKVWRNIIGNRQPLEPDPDTPEGFAQIVNRTLKEESRLN